MKIDRDNPFYPFWRAAQEEGEIKAYQRAIEILEESGYVASEFERRVKEEITILIHSKIND